VAVAVLAASACAGGGDDPSPTTSSAPPVTEVPAPISPLTVELVDAGARPQAVLAHDLAAGDRWTGRLQLDLAVGSAEPATIRGRERLDVQSILPGGVVATYALEELEITGGGPTVPPEQGDITGELVLGLDRTVTSATVQPSATTDTLAAALDPRLPFLLFPFPDEPIGIGARWEIRGPLSLFGNPVDLLATARLLRRDGDRFEIDVLLALQSPSGRRGGRLSLSGTGEIVGSVSQLGPLRGAIAVQGTTRGAGQGPQPAAFALQITR
jgi:hypothetical protein